MDVVQSRIRELSGQIPSIPNSAAAAASSIRVPLTLAILPTLLVQAGDAVYALPLARVQEVLHAPSRTACAGSTASAVLDRQIAHPARCSTCATGWAGPALETPAADHRGAADGRTAASA